MATANRVRLSMIREVTPGTTPNTPRMRTMRMTSESLTFTPTYVDSNEVRSDRMIPDPAKVMQAAAGGTNKELNFPTDLSPESEVLMSAFFATWSNAPSFDNDGTADSVITDAGTVANTYAVASGGAAVKANHLVRATGFTNSANNQIFPVASSTGTTIVGTALGLTAEAAPPGTARLKVIGFAGASADITATSTGLASTTLDFTTIPELVVGRRLKIDSTTSAFGFATSANNDWVRVTAVAAHALTLDNLPSGWSVDSGTSKTIRVYFGDQIKNGTTANSVTIEKGFLDQSAPTYIVDRGMQVNTLGWTIINRQIVTEAATWMGMGGQESTTTLDSSPDAATTGKVIAANSNVGRLAENGAKLTSPNWASEMTININNNLRAIEAVDSGNPVQINPGECTVNGRITTYFGDDTLLAKIYADTITSLSARVQRDNQALVWSVPRVTLRTGDPAVTGKNTDVMLQSDWSASYDSVTGAHILLDRFEYYA